MQLIDIATGWSERVAVLGRSQAAREAGFRRILGRRPFSVWQLHPDNGRAFCNNHLGRCWGEELTELKRSRSRPDHKNDPRFVEQKHDPLVRADLGDGRLDTPTQAAALDQRYEQRWLSYTLFQPVFHLPAKVIVDGKRRRTWATATTPYQRLVATGTLDPDWRATLDARYAQIKPRHLRRRVPACGCYDDLTRLWTIPDAVALAAD